jgi:hypothetical protein
MIHDTIRKVVDASRFYPNREHSHQPAVSGAEGLVLEGGNLLVSAHELTR